MEEGPSQLAAPSKLSQTTVTTGRITLTLISLSLNVRHRHYNVSGREQKVAVEKQQAQVIQVIARWQTVF